MSLKDTKFKYYSAQNLGVEKVYGSAETLQPKTVDGRGKFHTRKESSRRNMQDTSVVWSDVTYDVRHLIENFYDRFPVIVRVATGYSNDFDDGFTLDVGQVLQVYGDCEETRLKATDGDKQTLSIPYNLPVNVQLKTPSALGRIRKLREVIEKSESLPVTVRCQYSSDDVAVPAGTQLTITDVYQCKFLLTNAIHNGWLNGIDVIMVPEDLSARFTVAVGLNGANSDEWSDYCGMFARAARNLQPRDINGYNGVYWTHSRRQSRKSVNKKTKRRQTDRVDVGHYILRAAAYSSEHHRQSSVDQNLTSNHNSDVALGPRSPLMFRSVECLNLLSVQPRSNLDTELALSSQSSSTAVHSANQTNPLAEYSGRTVCSNDCSSDVQRELFSSDDEILAVTTTTTDISASKPVAGIKDFAVQVSLTPPVSRATIESVGTTSFPPTQYPRMGKRTGLSSRPPRSLVSSGDIAVDSLGGSMPSLQTVDDSDSLHVDTLDVEQLTSSSETARVTFQTGTSASDGACSLDEGYNTKDSSTSISSAELSRRKLSISPVYF